jgi:hypothetical protein
VPAFLWHAGVVDDERADRATLLDDGQDARARTAASTVSSDQSDFATK